MVESESSLGANPRSLPGVRVTVLGSSGAGKTSLIRRYCEKRFVNSASATLGVDYAATKIFVEDKEMHVHFFDTSGNAVFGEVRNEFYVDADGLMFVVDLTSKSSMEHLDNLVDEVQAKLKVNMSDVAVAIVANKSDDAGRRELQLEAIYHWCTQRNVDKNCVIETSARSGRNVSDAFHNLIQEIVEKRRKETRSESKSKKTNVSDHKKTDRDKRERRARSDTKSDKSGSTTSRTAPTVMPFNATKTTTTSTATTSTTTTTSSSGSTVTPTLEQLRVMQRLVQGEYMGDPWFQLGLSKRCTKEEVNKAYRKLAALLHPDKNKTEGADEAFKTLAKARRRIVDALSRFEGT